MRFQTTPQFDRDYKGLIPEHKKQFRLVLGEFNAACDAYAAAFAEVATRAKTKTAATGGTGVRAYRWPAALRVSPMKSAAGVWEMTWSFASPDGRATFEFARDDQGMMLRWRRIGDHKVYKSP